MAATEQRSIKLRFVYWIYVVCEDEINARCRRATSGGRGEVSPALY